MISGIKSSFSKFSEVIFVHFKDLTCRLPKVPEEETSINVNNFNKNYYLLIFLWMCKWERWMKQQSEASFYI